MGALLHQKIKKVAYDVAIVKKEARVVISSIGQAVTVVWNESFRLNVIAIIGSGHIDEYQCDEMILCEVGISRSRPYRIAEKSEGRYGSGEAATLHKRQVYAKMTEAQYIRVAPVLFATINEIADKGIAKRKTNPDNPLLRMIQISRVSQRHKSIGVRNWRCDIEAGVRFSVRWDESMLVSDICAAELFYNKDIKESLEKLVRFVRMYFCKFDANKKGISTTALNHFKEETIDVWGLPNYLWIEMLERLQEKKRPWYFTELAALIGWDGSGAKERVLARNALADPPKRLGNIRLRLTNKHANELIAVFEVFASPNWKQYKICTEDEIPF